MKSTVSGDRRLASPSSWACLSVPRTVCLESFLKGLKLSFFASFAAIYIRSEGINIPDLPTTRLNGTPSFHCLYSHPSPFCILWTCIIFCQFCHSHGREQMKPKTKGWNKLRQCTYIAEMVPKNAPTALMCHTNTGCRASRFKAYMPRVFEFHLPGRKTINTA